MKKVHRRVLLFISILAFLLLTPLVVLYGIGYRAQFNNVDPLPVGVILVETEPKGADVLVNGTLIGRSPEALPNLPKGNVTVTVKKEGYATWEKTVAVEPGHAVEMRDIRLFPTKPTVTTLKSEASLFSMAPNRILLAVVTKNNMLSIIDQNNAAIGRSLILKSIPKSLLWSPGSDNIIINNIDGSTFLVSVGRSNTIEELPLLQSARDIVWDQKIPGRLLFANAKNQLIAYNIRGNGLLIIAKDASSFSTSSRHIFVLNRDNSIQAYTLQGDPVRTDLVAPTGRIAALFVTPQGAIAYRMADDSIWVNILSDDKRTSQPVESKLVSATSQSIGWSPDGQMIYVQTDANSLYVYNVSDERAITPLQELHLITRLSRPISSPQWFSGGRHLIYQVADEILITEIDTRDRPITYQMDTTNLGEANATVGHDGQSVYYFKKNESVRDLVQANLIIIK